MVGASRPLPPCNRFVGDIDTAGERRAPTRDIEAGGVAMMGPRFRGSVGLCLITVL
jgi:hypothetical protein